MPQPHLYLFHRDFVLDEQTGAGVAEVMVANRAKTILQEHFAENPCHIVRGHKMPHIINADIVWCCTIKVDIENSKGQYIEKDKQEATKDGSESTKIQHGI